MSRVHSFGSFVAVLALGAPVFAFEQDGPPPVNTTRSISAGADDDIITQGDVDTHGLIEPDGHPLGSYMGVAPGAGGKPPRAGHADAKGPVTITWPGFQMRADGSSRVFIQSTAPIAAEASAVPGKYQVRLPGAHIAAATNRLPLDTRYFNTPVTKVSLSADHAGATLLLDLRGEITPHISSESDKSGYYFTYIELPAGSYLPKSAKPATASAEPASNAAAVAAQPAAQASAKTPAPAAVSSSHRTPIINHTHRTQARQPQGELDGRLALPD